MVRNSLAPEGPHIAFYIIIIPCVSLQLPRIQFIFRRLKLSKIFNKISESLNIVEEILRSAINGAAKVLNFSRV